MFQWYSILSRLSNRGCSYSPLRQNRSDNSTFLGKNLQSSVHFTSAVVFLNLLFWKDVELQRDANKNTKPTNIKYNIKKKQKNIDPRQLRNKFRWFLCNITAILSCIKFNYISWCVLGFSSPRKYGITGPLLPNPRLISTQIFSNADAPLTSSTVLLMQFGQFINHDMEFTSQFTFSKIVFVKRNQRHYMGFFYLFF